MVTATKWYSKSEDGRLLCRLCPRACRLKAGDRGFCFVRKNVGGEMVLDTYGKSTGFCIDPIEKKPLNHFLPGTPVLSFGTAGCNLGCKFCQNWDISKSREVARLSDSAMPDDIATAAKHSGCRSVAFTYNDPVIWAEYAIDTALACRQQGVRSVAVTAGYITPEARPEFFGAMDAANIDLKAFNEDFYFKLTGSHLQPVLETIRSVCNDTDCWVELTNLIIPDANDSIEEITRMCEWILDNVGPDVPLHFTAFHPDFRMTDRERTSPEILRSAYDVARRCGLHYVYVGNVHDPQRQSTFCHQCGELLIQRDWHQLGRYAMHGNRCAACGQTVAGVFDDRPGDWGAKRQPIRIATPDRRTEQSPSEVRLKMKTSDFTELGTAQQATIRSVASDMVRAAVEHRDPVASIGHLGDLSELPVDGVFITVKRGETLRGCCGRQGMTMKLGEAMADSAARTARDPRMPALSVRELPYLSLSVSLLGPMRTISARGDEREEAVLVGSHGLRIQQGRAGGLLLPQVAVEQGWNAHQFLDAVCRKAGLPAGTWRSDEAELMLFDGVHFDGPFETDPAAPGGEKRLLDDRELSLCRQWVCENLTALQIGATPMYYAMGVGDQEVLGIVMSLSHPKLGSQQWLQLNVKDSVPMQSSLYQMTEQAAGWIGNHVAAAECHVDLAVLTDCVHHGPVEDPDCRGIETASRAVVVTDGRRWSVRYSPADDLSSCISSAQQMETFRGATQLYSMHCDCSADEIDVSIRPRGDSRITHRPPAVAGRFYPAADDERESLLDRLLDGLPGCSKREAFAVMVPHAGLQFSGRVAAEIWRRVEVPAHVLIIGPKHTPHGVDWAVAPHDSWSISPTTSFSGDPERAKELAEAVPGLELDSQAHAHEHGIEVQLPLMARFCPQTKLTAIAMNAGDSGAIRAAAVGLADWYRRQNEKPLLVISSDMNHFADDQENRRRDRMALDALAGGDGEELLRVCGEESISMCGQIPAALVLMTLRELGVSPAAEEIAYATSADAGGDPDRVVGYAGVIWERSCG